MDDFITGNLMQHNCVKTKPGVECFKAMMDAFTFAVHLNSDFWPDFAIKEQILTNRSWLQLLI